MFWLSRPPYARWAIAGLVLVVGFGLELRGTPTVPHPFAAEQIRVGETIDETRVRWDDVPTGLLAPVELPTVASRTIALGEPIPAAVDTTDTGIPDGWWAVEVSLPTGTRPGMAVRLVTPDATTEGVVVATHEGDFGEQGGLVAVPASNADVVAVAALDASLMVMVGG